MLIPQMTICQKCEGNTGPGKTTYMFSITFCFPLRLFSVLPAGGEGVGKAAETESTLALAENIYVNLPRPG